MSAPTIYRLSIERFRSIKTLSWHPAKGVNVILGGGDVGKTTILDAVGLLLSPVNPTTLSDTDYHARNVEEGFVIEAVVSLPPESGINNQVKPSWPWDWNGKEAIVPAGEGNGGTKSEPVYRLRVCGTADSNWLMKSFSPTGQRTPSGRAAPHHRACAPGRRRPQRPQPSACPRLCPRSPALGQGFTLPAGERSGRTRCQGCPRRRRQKGLEGSGCRLQEREPAGRVGSRNQRKPGIIRCGNDRTNCRSGRGPVAAGKLGSRDSGLRPWPSRSRTRAKPQSHSSTRSNADLSPTDSGP